MDFKSLTDSVASKVSQTMVGDRHYMPSNVSAMQHDVRDAEPAHAGVLCAVANPCHGSLSLATGHTFQDILQRMLRHRMLQTAERLVLLSHHRSRVRIVSQERCLLLCLQGEGAAQKVHEAAKMAQVGGDPQSWLDPTWRHVLHAIECSDGHPHPLLSNRVDAMAARCTGVTVATWLMWAVVHMVSVMPGTMNVDLAGGTACGHL
jgi:hypothetical protein